MAQECDVCGKTAGGGNKVTTRGKAKYLGGVGTKITGINRRRFRPNLQRVRVTTSNVHPQRGHHQDDPQCPVPTAFRGVRPQAERPGLEIEIRQGRDELAAFPPSSGLG